MNSLAEQIIIDIIKSEMNLPNNQVVVRDMNFKIPQDQKVYVVVGMIDTQVYSAKSPTLKTVPVPPNGEAVYEVQETQLNEYIQVDILSRSNQAILKKNDVILALNSIYAKQAQEKNDFKMARLPRSFVNSSYAEGGSILNRFSLSFSCLTWYRKEKLLSATGGDYYDDFDTRVDDEKTIGTPKGIIEFNISAE